MTSKNKSKKVIPPTKGSKSDEREMLHRIMPIVLLALCAFFGICIYTQEVSVGALGELVRNAFFGLLGRGAYFAPVLLLLSALLWEKSATVARRIVKPLLAVVALVFIAAAFYVFGGADMDRALFFERGLAREGGGFLGGYFGMLLSYAVSHVGAAILLVLYLLCFFVFFFRVDPKAVAVATVAFVKKTAEARVERRRARRVALALEQEEARRREKKREEAAEREDDVTEITSARHTVSPLLRAGQALPSHAAHRSFYNAETDEETFSGEVPSTQVARSVLTDADRALFGDVPDEPISASSKKSEPAPTAKTAADALFAEVVESDSPEIAVMGREPIPGFGKTPVAPSTPAEEDEGDAVTVIETPEDMEDISTEAPVYRFEEEGAETEVDEPSDEPSDEPIAVEPVVVVPPAAPTVTVVTAEPAAAAEGNKPVADEPPKAEEPSIVSQKAHVIEQLDESDAVDEDPYSDYTYPPMSLLIASNGNAEEDSDDAILQKAEKLRVTLEEYGVNVDVVAYTRGPRLTRFELVPKPGVRIRSIENLVDEIAMKLEALSVRIEAPIPGKAAVGVEVPNDKTQTVRLRSLLNTEIFRDAPSKTTVCLGVDVVNEPVLADLEKMPHLLVAGATGMGKSVCINSILISLLYKARPDEVKLILIDPKKVEFKSYSDIPHLLVPVVTDPQKAAGALSWAVNEMERRYDLIEVAGVRNLKAYNASVAEHPERKPLPKIVIVIDELHDLMIQAKDAVEDSIARIAAKARAAGILLIIGTQRPSVNVITGVIKANIPSRIAFHVASQVDSRTILDVAGAEKLLNDGDMLFLSPGMKMMTPRRVQGAFLDDDEVTRVADYLRKNCAVVRYDDSIIADMERESEKCNKDKKGSMDMSFGDEDGGDDSEEEILYRAIEIAIENNKISTSLLQRKLKIGFGKAARIIDRMEEMGVVGENNGPKPREVLMTLQEYQAMRLNRDE